MESKHEDSKADNPDVGPPDNLYQGRAGARGSEAMISPEVAPRYKHDPETAGDIEKGEARSKLEETLSTESRPKHGDTTEYQEDDEYEPGIVSRYWRKYRPFGHAIIWLLVTAYLQKIRVLRIDGGSVDLFYIATNGFFHSFCILPSVSGCSFDIFLLVLFPSIIPSDTTYLGPYFSSGRILLCVSEMQFLRNFVIL
jgi:hypothetical protein